MLHLQLQRWGHHFGISLIKYLISDPNCHYKSFDGADFVCYRDKSAVNFEEKAIAFIKKAKQDGIEDIFLSEDYLLAQKLGARGVHLTSKQFVFIGEAKRCGLKVIISTHTQAEIEEAIRKKVDYITYSPIFETPNKGTPKGVEDLKKMVLRYNIPIIALGGIISEKEISKVKEAGVYGFASIRYFTGACCA